MKRLKLLLGMAALACAIGLTVKYGSSYRPVVGPVREIEGGERRAAGDAAFLQRRGGGLRRGKQHVLLHAGA